MAGLLRCSPLLLLACAFLLMNTPSAPACPFCSMQGQTLTGEVNQASMVLYGRLGNPKDETVELFIDTVVKDHKIRDGRKSLVLDVAVAPGRAGDKKFLVFFDVYKNKYDAYRGVEVKADSDLPKYLKGALEHQDAKMDKRLKFFFEYLDNDDVEISTDAFKEFANADYKDIREMAKDLPADKIAGWLDPKSKKAAPAYRYGSYASLLGHCGKREHAKLLHDMLEDTDKRVTTGLDGIMAGYVMLAPKEGFEYIRGVLKNPKKEFMYRYGAMRALRFFHDYRPDLVGQKELAEAAAQLLDHSDMADIGIEDLRKWGCWEMADRVLALRDKEEFYSIGIVRRAMLRFALCCKNNEKAAQFVAEYRKKDPEAVANAEELIKIGEPATPPAKPSK
jgi:hypothetical protein